SVNPYVNFSDLAWYEFALPPIDEQPRIVHTLLAAEDFLEAARTMQSSVRLLTTAVADKLIQGDLSDLSAKLCDGLSIGEWKEAPLGELCSLSGGHGFRPKDWSDHGLPIIRIQNVRGSTEFNFFAGDPDPSWIVEPGELLFSWAGVPGVSFGPG